MCLLVQKGVMDMANKRKSERHGMRNTRFYSIWCGIKKRCLNQNEPSYKNYGGRGIKICARWMEFKNFAEDMHESYLIHVAEFGSSNTSIERIDNNKDYESENCKWATRKEQNNNTRQVKLYPYKGNMLNLSDIAKLEGINYGTLRGRVVQYGWTLEQALERSKLKWSKKDHELYKHKGKMKTLSQIAKEEGIKKTTLFHRVKIQKKSIDRAINIIDGRKKS